MNNLSPNFTEAEFLRSETASKLRIDNNWEKPEFKTNAIVLCNEVLEPIRERFGRIKVTSGYRNRALNRATGGASGSFHLIGRAADIFPLDANINEVYEFLNKTHKGGLGDGRNKGFIHIDNGAKRRWTY